MRVAVIGGGIQGVGLALEFAARGVRVDLLEGGHNILQGASRNNEGKIHLGFVYANDPTLATARLMSRGAFAFAPALNRWIERDISSLTVSRPFTYVVHRDSLFEPDDLAERYKAISRVIRETSQSGSTDYFGRDDPGRTRRLDKVELDQRFDTSVVAGAFETAEIALDSDAVAELLADRVRGDPNIQIRLQTRVIAAKTVIGGVRLTSMSTASPADKITEQYDHVFNCAWAGRLVIDATAGILPERAWSFRRKYFVRVPAGVVNRSLDSTTVVLGAFGDVVQYTSGEIFLSWYPVGCQGIERDLVPREERPLNPEESTEMTSGIVHAVAKIVPALREHAEAIIGQSALRNGVIFALGTTDIDLRASLLHRRDNVGVRSSGNFHTVNTGKYTVAPLFAQELASEIVGVRKAA